MAWRSYVIMTRADLICFLYFEIAVPSNSVGIENVKDLFQDLEQALDKIWLTSFRVDVWTIIFVYYLSWSSFYSKQKVLKTCLCSYVTVSVARLCIVAYMVAQAK